MALWGGTDANETKPQWLTADQQKQVYATAQGWVAEPGLSGNSNTSATPEILVAFKNLAGTDAAPSSGLGLADITEVEFITTAVAADTPAAFSVRVRFNEEVDVTGNPTVTVTNSGQGTSTAAHLTCPYASGTGTNELVFTDAGWSAGECLNTNVLYVGADSVALAGGTIKDKGTNDASTITHTAAIGILQADGITVTAS